jgi:putative serine protease PepD
MSPKHLWTGDWRAEADEEASRRRGRQHEPLRDLTDDTEVIEPARRRRGNLLATGLIVAVIAAAAGVTAVLVSDDGTKTKTDTTPVAAATTPAQTLPAAPTQPSSGPVTPRPGQTRVGAIYEKASPAVVSVRNGAGSGSGFLVDTEGNIVTNEHVVENATRVLVRFGTDGRTLEGQVMGVDASSDLAVVKIAPGDAPADAAPLEFADSDRVAVGDQAIAIGNPFGLDRTATEGIISSVGRTITAPNGFQIDNVIQTDAAINPGNSGGPLLNSNGLVVGVNSQIATAAGGTGNVGIGFAVPSNTVRAELPALKQGQTVQHAYLGVGTDPTAQSNVAGAVLSDVNPSGPAARAGLQPGDVVTSIDGEPVNDPTDLSTIINRRQVGDTVKVHVRRGGESKDIRVRLSDRPSSVATP